MRLAWLTDIHLNFVRLDERQQFYESVVAARPDAVLLGGDIAEAPKLAEMLLELQRALDTPVYFVLGNHDFYHSSFANVQDRMRAFSGSSKLIWLTGAGVQLPGDETAVIGDDGWADGRLGDYFNSRVMLNDYFLISDFLGLTPGARLTLMNRLADEAAARISTKLTEACRLRRRILIVTHVPPFREACWYDGKPSDNEWLPHFSSKAMGDAIVAVMDRHPHKKRWSYAATRMAAQRRKSVRTCA